MMKDLIKKVFVTNEIISETYGTIELEKCMGMIMRIQRFIESPNKEDTELGLEGIVLELDKQLDKTCGKIHRIMREFHKETGKQLFAPVMNNGKVIPVQEMTREQKMNMVAEFSKLDLLNDDAVKYLIEDDKKSHCN